MAASSPCGPPHSRAGPQQSSPQQRRPAAKARLTAVTRYACPRTKPCPLTPHTARPASCPGFKARHSGLTKHYGRDLQKIPAVKVVASRCLSPTRHISQLSFTMPRCPKDAVRSAHALRRQTPCSPLKNKRFRAWGRKPFCKRVPPPQKQFNHVFAVANGFNRVPRPQIRWPRPKADCPCG